MSSVAWRSVERIETQRWRCGFCDHQVASDQGWMGASRPRGYGDPLPMYVAICPSCSLPSVVDTYGRSEPVPRYGEGVEHLPEDVGALYEEARRAVAPAPNSAAYACRKILMHAAVARGAEPGKTFAHYVTYLDEHAHTPPGSKDWVDEIRELGNDANHEITLMTVEEAKAVVDFTAMLLRLIYEYPERGRRSVEARHRKDAPA